MTSKGVHWLMKQLGQSTIPHLYIFIYSSGLLRHLHDHGHFPNVLEILATFHSITVKDFAMGIELLRFN